MVRRTAAAEYLHRFVIRPNRSLTWRQTQLFYLLMTMVTMTVAVAFAIQGFWPVLPFAGAELGVLGLGLWLCAVSGEQTEVVTVYADRVSVEKGRRRPRHAMEFKRAWAQVRIQRSRVEWYPTRLVIQAHGRKIGVGDFLNEAERQQLAGDLRRAISGDLEAAPAGGLAI